ncbi:MAG: ABC transporter ATP-binding protein [bacterium]|nr:ABC transporter ATP-binding protein [bacterium]
MKDTPETQDDARFSSSKHKDVFADAGSVSGVDNIAVSGISVRLVNCAKTFEDGTRALEPHDLTFNASETLVILGPSGCGKTTMLRIIAGLEEPDPGGSVFFEDEEVTEVPIEKRNVGMVFQSYALFPNMDVAQNIAYGLKLRGIKGSDREKRVAEMLAMMHIENLRNRHINQLSGGQKQRVALARAIAIRPRVLLLDEPLTALDAKLRESLRVEIDTLLRSLGITAIYVTHDQAEAMSLGDRIVVMDHGRVAQIGTPREIYFQPKTQYVAQFIGTINRLQCVKQAGKFVFPGGSISREEIPVLHISDASELDLFFRPENATVVESGQGHFSATVVASFFMGNRTRLIVDSSAEEQITIDTIGQLSIKKGQSVGIRIDPSTLITLNE